MSIKHRRPFPVLIIVLIHLLFIYWGGYFLSPEFTVYPYLTSLGIKPYLGLIDQHLPILFFGPISIPKFLTQNPQPLLGLFLGLVAISDILFFHLLKKNKNKSPLLYTALFAVSLFVFQGNTLWLETFIVPLILLFLLIRPTKTKNIYIGVLSTLIVLIRPTLAPVVLLLLFYKKIKSERYLLAGFLIPLTITLTYLVYHQLLPNFYNLFFNFNSTYYSALAGKLPSLRQIALVGIVAVPTLAVLLKNKKYLLISILIFSFLPAWPRFELTHLQPAIVLAVYFLAVNTNKPYGQLATKIILLLLIILSAKKVFTVNYGNFYLTKETQKISSFLKKQDQGQVFVLGGSDLIYPLSKKIPAGNFYLPSLPWYYANPEFVTKQLEALESAPQSLIVLNKDSSLAGQGPSIYAKPVYEYILEKYTVIETIGSYQIYKIK
jgi:hypothetical protein